jgi:hypothetical protein
MLLAESLISKQNARFIGSSLLVGAKRPGSFGVRLVVG